MIIDRISCKEINITTFSFRFENSKIRYRRIRCSNVINFRKLIIVTFLLYPLVLDRVEWSSALNLKIFRKFLSREIKKGNFHMKLFLNCDPFLLR